MSTLSPVLKQATPVLAVRGEGVHLYDEDGRAHLDFTAGIGVTSTGHCHPRVVEAAQRQVATLIHGQYTTVMHRPLLTLTERLGEVLPEGLDSLFFANSGSEAVEAAMRLARQATGRPNIVVFQGSFHGRTVGAASLTTSAYKYRSGFGPLMPGVAIAPFPHAFHYGWDEPTATRFALRELDQLLATVTAPADTAAFLVEPVLGEGGYVPANTEFLRGLRERAEGQVLFERATRWTDPPPVSADVSGFLHQTVMPPWGERMMAGEDGEVRRVPEDRRPVEELAAEIVRAAPATDGGDGETPPDTDEGLAALVAAVRAEWLTGPRYGVRSPGPVASSRFM